MGISLLNLLVPISYLGEYILITKTNRAGRDFDTDSINEIILFLLTIIGWNDIVFRFTSVDFAPNNLFV